MNRAPMLSSAIGAASVIGRLQSPPEKFFPASTTSIAFKSSIFTPLTTTPTQIRSKHLASTANRRGVPSRMTSRCDMVVKSTASLDADPFSSPSFDRTETELELEEKGKIGARVRVKVPLKVYHVARVPEVEITGMEGVVKDYVAVWKGKRISANLPYKVEFVTEIEGRGRVKFFAHLKDDEFELIE